MSEQAKDENVIRDIELNTNAERPKSILITGGTGLVGTNVIHQLLDKGRNIKAIYRKKIPDIPGKEKVEWLKGDILDVISLDEAMQEVEHVYHCAAIVSFTLKNKSLLFKTNIEGTANVVNASLAAGVKKLCYVSSVAALGKSKREVEINEKTSWSEETNSSNYGKSKYLAEVEVWRGIAEGLNAVIVNPSIILGAGDWNEGSTKIFKKVYEEFPWYTSGVTGFVDVSDVARAMIQLMDSAITNERFILSAENKLYKEVFTLAAKAFGKKPPYKKVNRFIAGLVYTTQGIKSMFTGEEPLVTKETAQAAQEVAVFNNSKLKSALPSFAYTPLHDTIKRVCSQLKHKNKLD